MSKFEIRKRKEPYIGEMVFTFHSDSGHGWLEVTSTDLNKLGLKESDFSPYSYKEPAWRPFDLARYYLEEDCDAGVFIEEFKKVNGEIHFTDSYVEGKSPIRKLEHLPQNN